MKGPELKKAIRGYQGKLAEMAVKKVLQMLMKNKRDLPEFVVGKEHHAEKMEELLDLDSNSLRIVGIHGIGGTGKTIIATVIYNKLFHQFDSCCFLENVRKNLKSQTNHDKLQSQLVSNLATGSFSNIVHVEDGSNKIKNVGRTKKVLLVLDDVDEKSQFDKLVRDSNWFDSRSRIIFTTRNKGVLDDLEATYKKKGLVDVCRSYEPPLLNPDHSLQLFSYHAFMQHFPPEDLADLAMEIASTAAGLPLALESIGLSLLSNKDKASWKQTLKDLKRSPNKVVLKTLRRSIKALKDQPGYYIFLDTACLFIGEDCTVVSYMWTDCELGPINAIKANVLRSLIKITDDNKLWMHDQLRDVGRQIVREESFEHPGERSRLWCCKEALHVFENRLGTNKVLALCLDFDEEQLQSRSGHLEREDFVYLQNLKFLRVGGPTDFRGDFIHLFVGLIWLQWKAKGDYSPTNFTLRNLVILNMSGSQIVDNWEGWTEIKELKCFELLDIARCKSIEELPDLSNLRRLKKINASECVQLSAIRGLKELESLSQVDIQGCTLIALGPPLDHHPFTTIIRDF